MRTPLRSLVSAILALLLVAALIAPLSSRGVDEVAPVVSISEQHGAAASGFATADLSTETLRSDHSSAFGLFIKPQFSETVVAERCIDQTDLSLPSAPHRTRPAPAERPDIETPAQGSTTRRALLSVYRL